MQHVGYFNVLKMSFYIYDHVNDDWDEDNSKYTTANYLHIVLLKKQSQNKNCQFSNFQDWQIWLTLQNWN